MQLLYPPPRGELELRAALTAYLGRVRGVRATPDQVVICGGFSQGLMLLCRALGRRGVTRIAVEDPCFLFHRRIIEAAGLEPVPVPVDDEGIQTSPAGRAGRVGGAAVARPLLPERGRALGRPAGLAAGVGAQIRRRW